MNEGKRYTGHQIISQLSSTSRRPYDELFSRLRMQRKRSKKACIIFFDEVDAIGGARFDDGAGGDNEVQRTMLELINQLDGFDPRGNIKVIMATNRSVNSFFPLSLAPFLMSNPVQTRHPRPCSPPSRTY